MERPFFSDVYNPKRGNISIIFGHCINYDQMFGKLLFLKHTKDFKQVENLNITYLKDGDYIREDYSFAGYICVNAAYPKFMYWSQYDEEEYCELLSEKMDYRKLEIKPGEKILILSTCDNERGNEWKFAVVYKKA